MTDIYLAGGMRTPFGDFGKSLKDVPLTRLGVHAAKACLEKAGLPAAKLDHLVWGNVLPSDQDSYFASRAIALGAGLPEESSAINVSRACGSGTQAIITAAEQIISGHGRLALAGGGENFRAGPTCPRRRAGARRAGRRRWRTVLTGPTAIPSAAC